MMAAHYQILHYAVDKAMRDSPAHHARDGGHPVGPGELGPLRRLQALSGAPASTADAAPRIILLPSAGRRQRDKRAAAPIELNRNVLFSCLGSPGKPIFSVAEPVVLKQGDKLMLCSDGLWASLPEHDIVNQLSQKSVEDAVPDLVEPGAASMRAKAATTSPAWRSIGKCPTPWRPGKERPQPRPPPWAILLPPRHPNGTMAHLQHRTKLKNPPLTARFQQRTQPISAIQKQKRTPRNPGR